ncbi:MAG: hypothetical protein KA316_15925 [Rhodoferax sp.]|nr:hypothetical protein [Rhodoferax sp.]
MEPGFLGTIKAMLDIQACFAIAPEGQKMSRCVQIWRSILVTVALLIATQPLLAEALFDGTSARKIAAGTPLDAESTVGGYPIYRGDHAWQLTSTHASQPNTMGVIYGAVGLVQFIGDLYAAEMVTTANLNQSGHAFYLTSNNCGGEHLVKNDQSRAGRGDSAWDNCLTIDPFVAKINGKDVTMLRFRVTQTQEGNRYYGIDLLLNPAVLGFASTHVSDWTVASMTGDPNRRQFMVEVAAWGKQLQSAALAAIAWGKPADAFRNVPPWRALASRSSEAGTALESALAAATEARIADDLRKSQALATMGQGLRVGDHLIYVDRDGISGAMSSQMEFSIDRIDSDQILLNGGSTVLGRDGTPRSGRLASTYIFAFGTDARATSAKFKIDGYNESVTVGLDPLGQADIKIGDVTLQVSKYAVRGRASYEIPHGLVATALPKVGAEITGELVIDNATGLTVSLRTRSRHTDYNVTRELVSVQR